MDQNDATPARRPADDLVRAQHWPRFRWFDKFAFPIAIELFPDIRERVRGTPARLEELLRGADAAVLTGRPDDRWSIHENVCHLIDLEGLWLARARNLAARAPELQPTDLQNRATDEANHNAVELADLLDTFRSVRRTFSDTLRSFTPDAARFASRHPRLGTPMTIVDLAFFVAEHDDHHLARISELLAM
jgi:uncharacterized damage-inducible protein DinB